MSTRAPLLPVFNTDGSRDPAHAIGFAASLPHAKRIAATHTRENALLRTHGFSLAVFQPTDLAAADRDAKQPYFVFAIGKTTGAIRS